MGTQKGYNISFHDKISVADDNFLNFQAAGKAHKNNKVAQDEETTSSEAKPVTSKCFEDEVIKDINYLNHIYLLHSFSKHGPFYS